MLTRRASIAVRAAWAVVLLGGAGCHKRPSGPSPHYDRGAAIHQDLYVRELDDAYLDPKMDEAVAELKQVPADSVSAHLAEELLAQIEKGRRDAQAARDAEAKALAAARQPTAVDPSQVLKADAPAVLPAGPGDADADAGVVDPYGPGASLAEINKDTGGCLVAGTSFREEGSGKTGATYQLAEDPVCRSRLPGFVHQTVLALGGRIYRRISTSEVKTEKVLPGAPQFLPDGGISPATPASAALPSNAGGATAPSRSDATSTTSNVAAEQNATPPPAPTPGAQRGPSSNNDSSTPNVAAEQNATPPPAPAPTVQPAQVQDATPPPAQ